MKALAALALVVLTAVITAPIAVAEADDVPSLSLPDATTALDVQGKSGMTPPRHIFRSSTARPAQLRRWSSLRRLARTRSRSSQ